MYEITTIVSEIAPLPSKMPIALIVEFTVVPAEGVKIIDGLGIVGSA